MKMIYFALVQSILTYGIIIWGSAYSISLEPPNVVHRIVRIILRQDFIKGNCTDDLFKKFKILNIEQLYNKLSTTKIYIMKNQFVSHNKNSSIAIRNINNDNLILFKPNTTMIKMLYIYKYITNITK